MITPKHILGFWIYNVTKKEAEDVFAILKSIQPQMDALKVMSHGGFLDKLSVLIKY